MRFDHELRHPREWPAALDQRPFWPSNPQDKRSQTRKARSELFSYRGRRLCPRNTHAAIYDAPYV